MTEPTRIPNDKEWMRDDCSCLCGCSLHKQWTDGLCDSCHWHATHVLPAYTTTRNPVPEEKA